MSKQYYEPWKRQQAEHGGNKCADTHNGIAHKDWKDQQVSALRADPDVRCVIDKLTKEANIALAEADRIQKAISALLQL